MDRSQQNTAWFTKNNPSFLKHYQYQAERALPLVDSRKGPPTMVCDGVPVHSKYDPLKEVSKTAAEGEADLIVHLGLGLGYMLDVHRAHPDSRTVIFEPDTRILSTAWKHLDLATLLTGYGATICVNLPQLQQVLTQTMRREDKIRLVALPYYARRLPEMMGSIKSMVEKISASLVMGERTVRKAMGLITEGSLRVLPHVTRLPGVERLRDVAKGLPGVIVSAGPSLDQNIHHLRAYGDRVVIFALGRTAKPLEAAGIQPHFLLHNEPKSYVRFIEGCGNLSKTTFVLSGQADPDFFTYPHGNTFVFLNPANYANRWIIERHPNLAHEELRTGGSVANEAFSMAELAGCDPIILLGQDLAKRGSVFYGFGEENKAFIHNQADDRQVPGYFGGTVSSVSSWATFVHWFETEARRIRQEDKQRVLLNATEGGARIAGFHPIKLQHALAVYCGETIDLEAAIQKAAAIPEEDRLEAKALAKIARDGLRRLENFKLDHERCRKLEKKLGRLLKGNLQNKVAELSSASKQLDRLHDAFVVHNEDFLVISGFMQNTLLDLNKSKPPTHGENAADNARLEFESEMSRIKALYDAYARASVVLKPHLERLARVS